MSLGMSKAVGMFLRVERSRLCSAARTVLAKEGEVGGSSAQCRWRSDAATLVSSDVPSSCGGRNRVLKEEQHALVESYVNEYRKRNAGKLPSVTDATKHAGGSYYTVRKIVQKLEYESRLPPSTSRTVISVESEHIYEKKSLTGWNKFRRRVTTDVDRKTVLKELTSLLRVKEDMKDTSVSSGKLVDHKEKADFMGSAIATWEAKDHPLQSPSEPEELAKRKDDAKHSRATFFWENLKTFADGIISIWRRK